MLYRDRWLCQISGPGCTQRATEVDHIANGDDHSMTNLQAVCTTCHREKTLREANRGRAAGGG